MPPIPPHAHRTIPAADAVGRPTGLLVASAVGALFLSVAGAALWWLRGEAVFTDTVLAALSWCF